MRTLMKINKTNIFDKIYKKLHQNQRIDIQAAIKKVADNPLIGERKIGDLNGIRVYKFKMISQLTLIAYNYYEEKEEIILLYLGSHENFYNELKKIK